MRKYGLIKLGPLHSWLEISNRFNSFCELRVCVEARPPLSTCGTKRISKRRPSMSAFGGKADMMRTCVLTQ